MNPRFVDPPLSAVTAVQAGLATVLGQSSQSDLRAMRANRGLHIGAAHETFHVGLTDVAGGKLLAAAKPTGWRFLVFDEDKTALGTAEAVTHRNGQRFLFGGLARGPQAEGTVRAAHTLELAEGADGAEGAEGAEEAEEADEAPQVRLLAIPALYVSLLWKRDQPDRLVPVAPVPSFLTLDQTYEEGELISILKPIAQERLEAEQVLEKNEEGEDELLHP